MIKEQEKLIKELIDELNSVIMKAQEQIEILTTKEEV